jgi:plastocyanin
VVAAGPGAQLASNYATPVVVTSVGGDLSFINADASRHDVVAVDAVGPDDQPWCVSAPAGQCPLFWSTLIGIGQQTPVLGTENLESSASYEFYCTLHPNMRGTLVVQ